MKLNLYNDYKDIVINDDIVLHINHNDEGYSFDIYSKKLYDKENYDEGYLGGTYVCFAEIDEVNKEA
jgi:hypothetical protein